MATALLLMAHGSRQPEANADLVYFAEKLRCRGHAIVECAYLEFAEPTIEAGGARCVEAGATSVVMVPYFLSAGVHVRRDLADIKDRLKKRFPEVDFLLAEPIGRHEAMLGILEQRVQEAQAQA